MINLYNRDCMEALKEYPSGYFDCAIVDPPYGIGMDKGAGETSSKYNSKSKLDFYTPKNWDNQRPEKEYFVELQRVSKQQIIFGGNYFADLLPASRGWIYWRKLLGGNYAHGELAYTSFDRNLLEFTKQPQRGGRIHPTQKPVQLYSWILQTYCKKGDKILDTHLGSGSIAIAVHDLGGFELTGYELDTEYYTAACKRLKDHKRQLKLFKEV